MPYIYKKRNNKSQKSTQSTTCSEVSDDFSSLLKTSNPSSRRSTPKQDSESLPPSPPPPTPWETLQMTEEDYFAMMQRVQKRMEEYNRECYMNYLEYYYGSSRYWSCRLEQLEREREHYNKKRGWSAADILAVERIDSDIEECQYELSSFEEE